MKTKTEIKESLEREQKFFEENRSKINEEVKMYTAGWINALNWVLDELNEIDNQ